ncbi:MAG: DNA mismatch repair protein MutS [Armatimonadota bacterium]|nr:DNA mismatch repair protein MutS [Armatimonadota bacterium]MDR7602020.1 DNA mismatch repair protein MutS [Armatimonadota bacterium]
MSTSTQQRRRSRRGEDELVPSRRQYLELKRQYPHAILLYRLGDFYEAFDEDARLVARDARVVLTSRSFGRSGRVPMAGIPHHALPHYLGRLLAAGHTVAIAEQLTPPGRGLIQRAVTRVLTPGTVAEPSLLPASENRYLAAILPLNGRWGLSWVDVSTGEFATMELESAAQLVEELARLAPAECLIPEELPGIQVPGRVTRLEPWLFDPDRAREALCAHFRVRSLEPYGCGGRQAATGAAGAILAYLERTNPALLSLLVGLRTETLGLRVGLDPATRRNLELTRSLRTESVRGSLLGVLDQTRTAQGARWLRRMLSQPTRDLPELRRRQDVIEALVADPVLRAALGAELAAVGDLERLVGRIAHRQASGREFLTLQMSLEAVARIVECLRSSRSPALEALAAGMDPCEDTVELVKRAVVEDEEGVRIRPGYSPELDAARAEIHETRRWLLTLEVRERERTGIRSLKVGYNKVFGYYLEVTRPNLHLVPPDYIRKQTVATGERFYTLALKEAEARILSAEERLGELEREALERLTSEVAAHTPRLLDLAARVAELDAFLSLAEVAARWNWTRPTLEQSEELQIVEGRHPVVEANLEGEVFIPNDCRLGGDGPRILLVTGPNMGGKSTYLRQVALIVLLAQIGSFVPAREARIGLVDRIFTRVGAQDDLAGGASTFLVEMMETATILHQATPHSLVILDEVGRGTGTQDGLAIARAVLEDLHDRIRARTLFATHYLELTALAGKLPGVANVHLAATEQDGRVIFLYRVRPGPASRAYGIQVARLAGIPRWVADRAEALLAEAVPPPEPARAPSDPRRPPGKAEQLPLDGFGPSPDPVEQLMRALRELDLERLTPLEALSWLVQQKSRLVGGL